ncbi:MAG: MFS transporter [Pirellulales bacterium]
MSLPRYRWTSELTRYHWFVLIVAALGWMFDCLDQQIFNLARQPAMDELVGSMPGANPAATYGGYATSIFLIGWATGGLFFGVIGDRYGRAKTMLWTILMYSLCTGLSAFSRSFWDFAAYRFLTGVGVGGEFAVGVALVAEVMPDRARPHALGLLQALSAVGNVAAAFIEMGASNLQAAGSLDGFAIFGQQMSGWRLMFMVGTVPALLAILIRWRLKEPEKWQASVKSGQNTRAGSYRELFGDPRWRKNALVGMALAFAGVVGLWGIGFFSLDLLGRVFTRHYVETMGLTKDAARPEARNWVAISSILFNVGGFLGIWAYSRYTHRVGRRKAFALSFIAAMAATSFVFMNVDTVHRREVFGVMIFTDIIWMIPLMGFCQLAIFGGYAIYFPELFPTRLRSTGTSFCYNVGRFVAAIGPAALGSLRTDVYGKYGEIASFRYSAATMCAVFLVGLIALPFAPETHNEPLPE